MDDAPALSTDSVHSETDELASNVTDTISSGSPCPAIDPADPNANAELLLLHAEREPAGDTRARELPIRVVEALLFASDAPLSAARLVELVGAGTQTHIRLAIAELNDQYTIAGMAFRIEEIARGYQMMTLAEYRPYLAKLNRQRAETRLSDAALETLSVIAYKQPVIRADIEAIRGVACGDQVARLRELGLVRLVGRAEVVGRPMLYGTTRKFLDLFGLADLDDLPPMEALKLRPALREKPEVSVAVSDVQDRERVPASAARRPIVEDCVPKPRAVAGA
jgi:segregation and condensation protein B